MPFGLSVTAWTVWTATRRPTMSFEAAVDADWAWTTKSTLPGAAPDTILGTVTTAHTSLFEAPATLPVLVMAAPSVEQLFEPPSARNDRL